MRNLPQAVFQKHRTIPILLMSILLLSCRPLWTQLTESMTMDDLATTSPNSIEVKFRAGTDLSSFSVLLPTDLYDSVKSIERLFTLSEEAVNEINSDLNRWFRITLKQGTNSVEFIEALRGLEYVESAEFIASPPPPPPQ